MKENIQKLKEIGISFESDGSYESNSSSSKSDGNFFKLIFLKENFIKITKNIVYIKNNEACEKGLITINLDSFLELIRRVDFLKDVYTLDIKKGSDNLSLVFNIDKEIIGLQGDNNEKKDDEEKTVFITETIAELVRRMSSKNIESFSSRTSFTLG